MNDFIFDQLQKLDKYDNLASRGRNNRIKNMPKRPIIRGAGSAPQTKPPLVGPGMWPPPADDSWIEPGIGDETGWPPPRPGWDSGSGWDGVSVEHTMPPTPSLQNVGLPMGYREWMGTQPYGGQISPFQPQGTDYWQEQYQDYLGGWNAKFGTGGRGPGMGTGPGMRKPGSGGPRDMGTPSMGNLLRGKPNKSY